MSNLVISLFIYSIGPVFQLLKSLIVDEFWKNQTKSKIVFFLSLFIFLIVISRISLYVLVIEKSLLLTQNTILDNYPNLFFFIFNILYWTVFAGYVEMYKQDKPVVKYIGKLVLEPIFILGYAMLLGRFFS